MNELLEAHRTLIKRYIAIIEKARPLNSKFLLEFCYKALELKNSDKLSRWVGFVQGILYSNGIIDIREEREFSRNVYKPIYDILKMNSDTVEVT